MKFQIWLFAFFIFLFLFSPLFSSAAFGQVVINEFSSGTTSDWVEIYNLGETSSLASLKLEDADGNRKEFPGCFLSSGGAYAVDFSNWLNNAGDRIVLRQGEAEADCVAYGTGPACSGREVDLPALGATEFGVRQPEGSGSWTKSSSSTKSDNSLCLYPTPTPTSTPTFSLTPTATSTPILSLTPSPTPVSYSNISISEFLANPESGNEKVEIKNSNDFEVNLIDWQIDDVVGGGQSPKKFSATISANDLFVVDLNSNSFLDNNGDDVRLLDFSGTEKDKKTYSSTTKGKSWSKDTNGNWCETEPSFGGNNPDCPSSTSPTSTPTPTLTPTPTPTSKASTPTPTLTPTAKLSPTPTANPEVLGQEATESGLYLLGESTPSAVPTGGKENHSQNLLPFAFIGLGVVLIGAAFIPFLPRAKIDKLKALVKKKGGIMKSANKIKN